MFGGNNSALTCIFKICVISISCCWSFLTKRSLVDLQCGYQNQSIMEIATIVKKVTQEELAEKGEIPIVTTPSNDKPSYRITSDNCCETGVHAETYDRGCR